MKAPYVSIVILNYNGALDTVMCIDSIEKMVYKNYEIVLVDNGSTDDSVAVLKRYIKNKSHIKLKLIESKKNLGFAGGCNLGIHYCKYKYVALLNNDIVVDKNWIGPLISLMIQKKSPIISCKVINLYYKSEYSFNSRAIFNLFGYLVRANFENGIQKFDELFMASAGACLLDKDVMPSPFDPLYFAYGEDIYLAWVLRLKGYQIYRANESIVYHKGESVIKSNPELKQYFAYLGERNRLLNFFYFYNTFNLIVLFPVFIASLIITNISKRKNVFARFRAYFWVVSHIIYIHRERKKLQNKRKVKDNEISVFLSSKMFEESGFKQPLKFAVVCFNSCCRLYFRIFNIKTID